MCEKVRAVYSRGAELTIATDGLVFNDLVGIPNEDTWNYGEALVAIIEEKGFAPNIKFARASELFGDMHTGPLNKQTYLALIAACRGRLMAEYGTPAEEVRKRIFADKDTELTYRGFIKFLKKDLQHGPMANSYSNGRVPQKEIKRVAMDMMIRSETFTKFIAARLPNAVRLSIHPSNGIAKITIPLVEVGSGSGTKTPLCRSPWHSVVAVSAKGNYRTVHAEEVRETHTLVRDKNGSPYYYREKSPLWDDEACWGQEDEVVFEPTYPHDLHIYPREPSSEMALSDEQIAKLRVLVGEYRGTVRLSGFRNAAAVNLSAPVNSAAGRIVTRGVYMANLPAAEGWLRPTAPTADLGALSTLPVELQLKILGMATFQAVTRFAQVNRRASDVAYSLVDFNLVRDELGLFLIDKPDSLPLRIAANSV
ncbi:pyoverdine/dityrosine biosynthesis protein [Apiospora arundinis]|uniref:Pyoverdine/dityrosine biosynthesis protein n=1 Tax=Apiospora arundinis TaxID=335852 RepID=A0ABR2JGZ1_9PEZI